jgi:hypothetical protein
VGSGSKADGLDASAGNGAGASGARIRADEARGAAVGIQTDAGVWTSGASAVPVLKYIALLFVCMNFKLCFTWFTENKQLSMLHACLTSFEFWSSYIMLEGEQNPVLVSSFAYIHVSASILVYLKLYVTLGRVELKPM